VDPKYRDFLRTDGIITVRLKKALFGCIQSAVFWYDELASTLEAMGFVRNPYNVCSFRGIRDGSTDRILVYVDDLFITSKHEHVLTSIATTLKQKYSAVTSNMGLEHNFLGIHWDFRVPGQATLSMDGYIKDIIKKDNVTKKAATPATDNLFRSDPLSTELTKQKQEHFHSLVMTLQYLAKRVRPDIHTSVSWCASRVLNPTKGDENKDRILQYLLNTINQKLILRIGNEMVLRAFVDASFGLYEDGKSVTGVVIMIGNAIICVKSGKQKILTRSSTESELVGISDALSLILWSREYLLSSGIDIGTAIVFQDNKSTIFLANKGRSTSERSRHIKIRHFFVSHYIDAIDIKSEYLPTAEMIADVLTKPLHGVLFTKLRGLLECNPYSSSQVVPNPSN
jgi:Reverse transcriptase (RNA-dependent DNA polymerase)